MQPLKLYRKRFIPNETVLLKDDIIVKHTNDLIITKWNTLKPRTDIASGVSAYFLNEGYKISKIYNSDHQLVYWYCDIIEASVDTYNNSIIVNDLLVDILIYPDHSVRVLDLDELSEALSKKLLTESLACKALNRTNMLLQLIYTHDFQKYQSIIDDTEQNM